MQKKSEMTDYSIQMLDKWKICQKESIWHQMEQCVLFWKILRWTLFSAMLNPQINTNLYRYRIIPVCQSMIPKQLKFYMYECMFNIWLVYFPRSIACKWCRVLHPHQNLNYIKDKMRNILISKFLSHNNLNTNRSTSILWKRVILSHLPLQTQGHLQTSRNYRQIYKSSLTINQYCDNRT
jgi:hypothetical protein